MIAPTVLHALKPAEVEHAVNPHQDVVVGDQVAQRAGNDEFELTARLASRHAAASPAAVHQQRIRTRRLFQQPQRGGMRSAMRLFGQPLTRLVSRSAK